MRSQDTCRTGTRAQNAEPTLLTGSPAAQKPALGHFQSVPRTYQVFSVVLHLVIHKQAWLRELNMSLMTHSDQPLVSGQPSEKTCQRLLLTRSLNPCIPSIHFHLGYIELQQGPSVPDPPAHSCPFIFTFPLTLSGGDLSHPKQYFPCGIFCIHTGKP